MTNSLYLDKYRAWAGDPMGRKPDFARCCKSVTGFPSHFQSQCSRKRGHGPDKAYCKQHDPDVTKKREADAAARSQAKWQERLYEIYGKSFYDALKKIAGGHNDARGLALKMIAKVDSNPEELPKADVQAVVT